MKIKNELAIIIHDKIDISYRLIEVKM